MNTHAHAHAFKQGQKVLVRDWDFQEWREATYVAYFYNVTMPYMVEVTRKHGEIVKSVFNECRAYEPETPQK
jgi:hypothetical protein